MTRSVRHLLVVLSGMLVLGLLVPLSALAAQEHPYPDSIPLPTGFRPEGIAVGKGHTFYVGSIPTGAIYQGDLRTGEGSVLVPAQAGRAAIGLSYDERTGYLFVAGGGTGDGFVYDTATRATVATFDFASGPAGTTFVNDVVVTQTGAFFTDSRQLNLYYVPLSPGGGLPSPGAFESIPLGGEFAADFVVGVNNANGIDATPNGKYLIVVNSNAGTLYRVEVGSWQVTKIDLGGATVTQGDGILLSGKTLYVVRNRSNEIVVIRLSPDLTSGEVVDTITDPDFSVPTTIARFGSSLYAVNARFGIADPDTADYSVVLVDGS